VDRPERYDEAGAAEPLTADELGFLKALVNERNNAVSAAPDFDPTASSWAFRWRIFWKLHYAEQEQRKAAVLGSAISPAGPRRTDCGNQPGSR
jgi:hypothetical protein